MIERYTLPEMGAVWSEQQRVGWHEAANWSRLTLGRAPWRGRNRNAGDLTSHGGRRRAVRFRQTQGRDLDIALRICRGR